MSCSRWIRAIWREIGGLQSMEESADSNPSHRSCTAVSYIWLSSELPHFHGRNNSEVLCGPLQLAELTLIDLQASTPLPTSSTTTKAA